MGREMNKKNNNNCALLRGWLKRFLTRKLRLENSMLYYHVLDCEKCQQRLVSVNKVNNALMMVKSQSHKIDLLARANEKTVNVLRHSLRENPKAEKLKTALPEPRKINIFKRCNHSLINAAACFVVFLLLKTHIVNSMQDFQAGGEKVMSNYYENNLGEDLAKELDLID